MNSQDILVLSEQIQEDFPEIDVLINNAGFNPRKTRIEDYTIEEVSEVVDLNLKAPIYLTKQILPMMKKHGHGHIINITSAMAYLCKENWAPYVAAKAGQLAFSRVLSKECAPHGIRVTSIVPGGVDTTFREEERPNYMSARSVAGVVAQIIDAPDDLVFHEVVIKPLEEIL